MSSMKLLILSHNLARPSYRQRIGDYLPYLKKDGMAVDVHQFSDHKLGQWALLKSARNYDVVLLHKKCLNWFDAKILRRYAKTILYDFDDAVMYNSTHPESIRTSHMRLFERTIRLVDCVIAGNEYLAQQAQRFCKTVHVLPTGLETGPFASTPANGQNGHIRLGWIGSSSTLPYLQEIAPALENAAKQDSRLVLRIIADRFLHLDAMPIEKHSWSLQTQAAELLACDIGLAPLPDNRFTRGKCGFKILQYFAAGLPAIASPVGINAELIERSGAGLTAVTPAQWQQAILTLTRQPQLRAQMGQRAREFVKQYDTAVLAERFVRIIRSAKSKTVDRGGDAV